MLVYNLTMNEKPKKLEFIKKDKWYYAKDKKVADVLFDLLGKTALRADDLLPLTQIGFIIQYENNLNYQPKEYYG